MVRHLNLNCMRPALIALFVFQSDQQLDCSLDLMRRLPPQQIEKNLSDLIDLVPGKEKCHVKLKIRVKVPLK